MKWVRLIFKQLPNISYRLDVFSGLPSSATFQPPTSNLSSLNGNSPDTMVATSTLRNEDIRALDQTRQRLLQLTTAIQTLQTSLPQSDPLPSW